MIALIIMGILTAALSRLKDDQTTAQWVDRAVSTLRENTQVVRSQILLCAVSSGNDYDDSADGGSASGNSLLRSLPKSEPAGNGGSPLEDVSCDATGDLHLFDGANTVFLPRPPNGFEPWRYVNNYAVTDGEDAGKVFVYTSTADPNGIAAINRLSRSLYPDEHEVRRVGTTVTFIFLIRRPDDDG